MANAVESSAERQRRSAAGAAIAADDVLERHRRRAGAAGAAARRPRRLRRRRRLRLAPGRRRLAPVAAVNRVDMSLLKGIDRVRDMLVDNTERFAARPAGQQRAAVGRARHGQVVAGQGRACRGQRRHRRKDARPLKLIEIHREDIESLPDLMALMRAAPYRFIVFCDDLSFDARRHLLQVAQGGARRRHRGPARQRDLLRHLEPPPSDAARHDGERALDRDQSGRGGRGESLAVRPLRPVARLPPLQPGRISRDGRGLCRALRHPGSTPTTLRREALEWATTRGARSGRVAWQFVQDLAGRLGVPLTGSSRTA